MPPPTVHVVAALIRRGDELPLCRQQGPDDEHPEWMLPGAMVDPGEGLERLGRVAWYMEPLRRYLLTGNVPRGDAS